MLGEHKDATEITVKEQKKKITEQTRSVTRLSTLAPYTVSDVNLLLKPSHSSFSGNLYDPADKRAHLNMERAAAPNSASLGPYHPQSSCSPKLKAILQRKHLPKQDEPAIIWAA